MSTYKHNLLSIIYSEIQIRIIKYSYFVSFFELVVSLAVIGSSVNRTRDTSFSLYRYYVKIFINKWLLIEVKSFLWPKLLNEFVFFSFLQFRFKSIYYIHICIIYCFILFTVYCLLFLILRLFIWFVFICLFGGFFF